MPGEYPPGYVSVMGLKKAEHEPSRARYSNGGFEEMMSMSDVVPDWNNPETEKATVMEVGVDERMLTMTADSEESIVSRPGLT